MPSGSAFPGPAEAFDCYRAVIEASGKGDIKGAKNPYTSCNGHMVSFLTSDGVMALHLSDELEAEFRAQNESGPVIQHGRTMRGYSSVPPSLLSTPDDLQEWHDRAWEWMGTMKPKPTKKSTKKSAK